MVGSLHRSFLLKILVFIPVQRLANIHYNRQSYLFSMSKKMKLFEGWGYISFKWLLWLLLKNNIIFKCQSWTWRMKFRILFVKVFFLKFVRTNLEKHRSTAATNFYTCRSCIMHKNYLKAWRHIEELMTKFVYSGQCTTWQEWISQLEELVFLNLTGFNYWNASESKSLHIFKINI